MSFGVDSTSLQKKYNFYHLLEIISDYDITKLKHIRDTFEIGVIFQHLDYLSHKSKVDKNGV